MTKEGNRATRYFQNLIELLNWELAIISKFSQARFRILIPRLQQCAKPNAFLSLR
jgi:hypothetical protein